MVVPTNDAAAVVVPAWDPQLLVEEGARTPPLDARGPVVPVAELEQRLLQLWQQQEAAGAAGAELACSAEDLLLLKGVGGCFSPSAGLGIDLDDPFPDYLQEPPSCSRGTSLTTDPLAAAAAAAAAAASASVPSSNSSSNGGTATPNIFDLPTAASSLLLRADTAGGAGSSSYCTTTTTSSGSSSTSADDAASADGEGGDDCDCDAHSLMLVEAEAEEAEQLLVAPSAPQLLVAYADAPAALTRNVKLYLGPLACNLDKWRAWGLPSEAWRPFADAVHADPAAVDAHAAVLLAAARAGGLAVEEVEGGAFALRLPSVDLRPMASLEVLVASPAGQQKQQHVPLMEILQQQQSQSEAGGFWSQYFRLANPLEDGARLATADVAAVYEFLVGYLLQQQQSQRRGASRHWEEEALVNGLRVVLLPLADAVAAAAVVAHSVGLVEQQQQQQQVEAAAVAVAAVTLPPLLADEEEATPPPPASFDFEEEQLDCLLFGADGAGGCCPLLDSDNEGTAVVSAHAARGGGKQLARLREAMQAEGEEEGSVDARGLRRSGRRAAVASARPGRYAEAAEAGSDAEEDEEEEASESEEEAEVVKPVTITPAPEAGLPDYDYPGRAPPAGKELADRGRHKCRVPGCAEEYRWPDYLCKVHGGGKCQFFWWDDSRERCPKFHQSRNSKGELLCGEHCRLTGARYGEQSRRAKAGKASAGSGASGKAAAAAKKTSKRVPKRKVWA